MPRPLRRSRPGSRRFRALLESLETRTLLSAYALSTVTAFHGTDGLQPFGSALTIDSHGNLFGSASSGGTYGFGLVYEIPAGTSTITPIASFTGSNGNGPFGKILFDNAGNLYGVTSGGNTNTGTVFVIPAGTHSIATIASFNGTNGSYPIGLTIDAQGNLYGVTQNAGAIGEGNVFEIVKGSGTVTVLGSFNGANGAVPEGNLLIDANGNIFGSTEQGGAHSAGTLFEIPASTGSLTLLASFDANGDNGMSPMGDLVMDASGNLFGTAQFGGIANGGGGNGVVFELAQGAGTVTPYALFTTATGINPFTGLIMDSHGNMFGATTNSGTNAAGTLFEISAGTSSISYLASLPGPYGDISAGGLAIDANGNLFGTTDGGGNPADNGIVFELSPTTATHLVFGQGPLKTVANQTMPTITAKVEDAQGRVISNDHSLITLSLAANPSAGTLAGTTTVQALDGIATFSNLSIDQYGQYTLHAADGALISAISSPFSIVPSPLMPLAALDSSTGNGPVGKLVMDSAGNLFGVTSQGGANGVGEIFELQKGATFLTPVVSFDAATGARPNVGLTIDAHGNLFGATTAGGAAGRGTLFELPHGSGTITVLSSFFLETPASALMVDSAGDLFGISRTSGANSDGEIFELPAGSTTLSSLASFTGISWNGQSASLLLDTSGNLFTATPTGGDNNDGAIFELPANASSLTLLASFNGINGSTPGNLLADSNGNLYGITASGGDHNLGTLFVLPAASQHLAVLTSFDPAIGAPSSLSIDAHNNFFGTAGNILFKSPADSGTLIAIGTLTSSTGTTPEPLLIDAAGNIFGATSSQGDNGSGMLFRFANAPAAQMLFAHSPSSATAGQLQSPIIVTVEDADGYLVMSDDSTVSLAIASGPNAPIVGTTTVTAQFGVANFFGLSFNTAGDYIVSADNGLLPIVTSDPFTISPIAPANNSVKLVFTHAPAGTTAGQTLSVVTVAIEDAQGNIVTADNSAITLSTASGPAGSNLLGTLTVQAQNGTASFTDLALGTAGNYTLFASDATLTPSASTSFAISPGAPSRLSLRQNIISEIAGANLSPFTFDLTDAFGNLITGNHATITLAIYSGPDNATLKGTTTATLNSGSVTFKNISIAKSGTYTLVASGASLVDISNAITISAAAPAKLVFLQAPGNVAPGAPFPVSVALEDRFGNLVLNPEVLTLSIASGPKNASLSGPTTALLQNGTAQFSALSLAVAGAYKLKAAGAGFTLTSSSFSIAPIAGSRRVNHSLTALPWST